MEDYLQMLEVELKSRGFSRKTIKSYTFHVARFLRHITPDAPDEKIKRYFVDMSEKAGPLSINIGVSAVKFFYIAVMGRKISVNFMKRPKKIPEVLTKEEVISILGSITNAKHKLLIETVYGCGLRVSEAAKLKKCDLRFGEGVLIVRAAKGNKDRTITLPKTTGVKLKAYIDSRADSNPYVFDSARGEHITIRTIECILKNTAKKAGIAKNIHVHTLRHSYATHLLEQGTDVRIIQKLLGHSNVRTTEIYTHVSTKLIKDVVSPIDTLNGIPPKNVEVQ